MTPLQERFGRWLDTLRTLTAVLLVASGVACRNDPSAIPSVGTLERDRIELTAETNEPIVEIVVREGDIIDSGQLLVRLDNRRLAAQVEQARAVRDEAGARLAEAQRGPRQERIAEARARLAGTRSAVVTAERDLERVRALAETQYESQARLDSLQARYDETLARRDEARAALEAMLEGTTVEELDQARSALAAAEAALTDVSVRLARLEVRATRAGQIDALPFEVGERPPAGAVVAVLLADQAPYARVYVPEPVRVNLVVGASAEVVVDGLGAPLEGRLRVISHDAVFTPYFALTRYDRSRLSYLAEVDLVGEKARDLPTGVPVEVRFDLSPVVARDER
jgi:HlyD family secretion protein